MNPLPARPKGTPSAFFDFHKLYADFVREQAPRVRPPKALRGLSELHQKVYVRMRWGWDDQRISGALHIDAVELPAVKERIEAVLRAKGWKTYWDALGPSRVRSVPLLSKDDPDGDEDGRELQVADSSAPPDYEASVEECRRVLGLALGQLTVRERVLLRMKYGGRETAGQLAVAFKAEQREIYYWIESALLHLRAALPRLLSDEQVGDLEDLKEALEVYFDPVYLGATEDSSACGITRASGRRRRGWTIRIAERNWPS